MSRRERVLRSKLPLLVEPAEAATDEPVAESVQDGEEPAMVPDDRRRARRIVGPAAGLAAVDACTDDARLTGYPRSPATRADLLRRLGRRQEAEAAHHRALRLTSNTAERDFLTRRLARIEPHPTGKSERHERRG